MGCDGGTIPRRDELVRTKKKPEQKDKHSELSFKWGHCTITQQPLQYPIVACQLGRLYNKEAVIEAILDHTLLPEIAKHIKSLKDVKDLNLTENPAYKNIAKKGDSYSDNHCAQFICPVIGLEMNGKFRFIFLWNCGCVISERALKAVKTSVCHKCQKSFTDEDIIILNGTDEDVENLRIKMAACQARLKAEKKAKKDAVSSTTNTLKGSEKLEFESKPGCSKQNGIGIRDSKNSNNGFKDSKSIPSLKRSSLSKGPNDDNILKKIKPNYSVATDPKASEVFKSLFTSHKKATEQSKAHWVTYNPFYN